MTKKCECAAHSAVECCCGAWDEPKREWVGLTMHEEVAIMRDYHDSQEKNGWGGLIKLTEAKLKEKNGYD